ncbi:MAG TPA: YncE family protein, partial [Solirubrobacterales bacterium]|nr:YncE family protein [Solirubrobacterales bacterium]
KEMPEAARRSTRLVAVSMLAIGFACLALASKASAAQIVFWGTYNADKISHAPIGAGNGTDIPIPPAYVDGPYGTAVDSAAGKVYWANFRSNSIGYANFDGSGAGLLNTSGASVDEPNGLAIDPAGGRIYWANAGDNSISYASLNGSGGGNVNTASATVDEPYGVAIDPAAGRIYWASAAGNAISYANLNGSGGGADLDTSGAPVDAPDGVAIDAAAGKIYWANYRGESIGYASLAGGSGGQVSTPSPPGAPAGVAIDPALQTIYWGDEELDQVRAAGLQGGTVQQPATSGATLETANFPVLLESPRNWDKPTIQGQHKPGATLTCTKGTWQGDLIESFLYRAPQSFSYQWFRNGKPIAGATAATTIASKVGAYTCDVTATNFAGFEAWTSPLEFNVNATVAFRKTTFNRKKGTATVRVAVTGAGRLDAYGKGVANASRKHVSGTAKIVVRASGKALIKLRNTGKTKVKATIAYTPEGGKAIKRRKTIALKKKLRR